MNEESTYYRTSVAVFQSVCTVLGGWRGCQRKFPVATRAWTRQTSEYDVHDDDEEVCIIMSQILNEE